MFRSAVLFAPLVAFMLAGGAPAPAVAQERSYTADYTISYLGLSVARARFTTTIAANGGARIDGSLSSAGIARLFDRTEGTTSAWGSAGIDSLAPQHFALDYVSGKRKQKLAVSFAGGRAASTSYDPAPRPRRPDWIPVADDHLAGVVDPLTATLVRADRAEDVCNRVLSIYDGWMRADLRLQPVVTGPIAGHAGIGATCSAKFVPISGYRANSRDMAYMRDRSEIRISFAPLGESGYFAPVEASVGTRVGTIRISARRIEAS